MTQLNMNFTEKNGLHSNSVAEVEVIYKLQNKIKKGTVIKSSLNLSEEFKKVWTNTIEYKESVFIIGVNRANEILTWSRIAEGGVSGCIMDRKIIFQHLLNTNCSAFFLAHNHPSGNPRPSDADIGMTRKIKQAGEIVDIDLLDHLILTKDSYYSLADNCEL